MSADVKTAAAAVTSAEAAIAAGKGGVDVAGLHKLRDRWRHADLTAQGARSRAEQARKEARLDGLAEIGAQVDELAGQGRAERLAGAVQDVATAFAALRDLATAHDADVAALVAAATDLGAEPEAPGGPRPTSANVAVRGAAITHGRITVQPVGQRIERALSCVANGDTGRAVAELQAAVIVKQPRRRPDHLFRSSSGALLTFDDPLPDGIRTQIGERGGLQELSPLDVDRYLAGEIS
jgi:hypothetical protein